jgi:hypothetical protein
VNPRISCGLEGDVKLGAVADAFKLDPVSGGSHSLRNRAAPDGHGNSLSSVPQTIRTGQVIFSARGGPLGTGWHPPPFIPVTNPLERFNREIGRRTDVVGIFPDDPSLIRLVSMLAIEANDEWLVGRSYISQGSMATLYDRRSEKILPLNTKEEVPELIAA